MTAQETVMDKIHKLPESLLQEVNDFVEFLVMKRDNARWQLWKQFAESLEIADSDLSDYLSNLENHEEGLARGEIQW